MKNSRAICLLFVGVLLFACQTEKPKVLQPPLIDRQLLFDSPEIARNASRMESSICSKKLLTQKANQSKNSITFNSKYPDSGFDRTYFYVFESYALSYVFLPYIFFDFLVLSVLILF